MKTKDKAKDALVTDLERQEVKSDGLAVTEIVVIVVVIGGVLLAVLWYVVHLINTYLGLIIKICVENAA